MRKKTQFGGKYCVLYFQRKHRIQKHQMLALLQKTYWTRTGPWSRWSLSHRKPSAGWDLSGGGTDYVCAYYICDVIVDPAYRGQGISKALMEAVVKDFGHLRGLPVTSDAHGLYAQFGFTQANSRHMGREPQK